MIGRRNILFGGSAFAVAQVTRDDLKPPAPTPTPVPDMFFVYRFNAWIKDYEFVGGYSKREEAEAFVATLTESSKGILQCSWKNIIDMETTARLGEIAEIIREHEHRNLGI